MRKLLIAGLFLILLAVPCIAGDMITFAASACETNTSAVTTYIPERDLKISGYYIDTIIVDQTGVGTGTVSVATLAGQGTGASRSILLDTSVSADGSYPVRDLAVIAAGTDVSNSYVPIPLYSDKLRLTLFNWGGYKQYARCLCDAYEDTVKGTSWP